MDRHVNRAAAKALTHRKREPGLPDRGARIFRSSGVKPWALPRVSPDGNRYDVEVSQVDAGAVALHRVGLGHNAEGPAVPGLPNAASALDGR